MRHLLHRVGSVLFWTAVVVLGAFGIYFSFANYPLLAIAVTLLVVGVLGYSERRRRQRQRAADRARRLRRPPSSELLDG